MSKEYNAIAVKNLLLDQRVKVDRDSFALVIQSDNRNAFKMHLKCGQLTTRDIVRGFECALRFEKYSMVRYLVKHDYINNTMPEVRPNPEQYTLLETYALSAAINGDTKLFKYMLRKIDRPDLPETIIQGPYFIDKNLPKFIRLIMKYGTLSPTVDCSAALRKLSEIGDVTNVRKLLTEPKFNIRANIVSFIFKDIMYFKNKEILKLLAQFMEVNPADSSCMELAIRMNDSKMLKRLLRWGVCDPMANNAKALQSALMGEAQVDSLKLTKILLNDPRMDLSRVPTALRWAHMNFHYQNELFKLLLQQPNINPLCRDPDSDPMTFNAKGFFTIPVLQGGLLDYTTPAIPDDEKDPTIIDSMLGSFSKIDPHLLFLVLTHPRVNFDYYAGYTIARATQCKKFDVAEVVLDDPRVHVIDKRHRRIALDCAKANSLKEIVAKIRALKKATLDFRMPYSD